MAEQTHKKSGGAIFLLITIAFMVVLVVLIEVIASASRQEEVSRKSYETWPFDTADTIIVKCEFDEFGGVERHLALLRVNDRWYGMNGAAIGVGGYMDGRRFLDRDAESGAYDSDDFGTFSDLRKKALSLCD